MPQSQPMIGDAYGLLLEEASARIRSGYTDFIPEPVEFSDGLLVFADARRYFHDVSDWPPLDHVAMNRASGRVLDVGAGAGRHSLYLQSKGIEVVAMEPSPGAARVARSRGIRHVLPDRIEDFDAGAEEFDVVLMLGNNLGLLQSLKQAPILLRRIARAVPIGGVLVGDCGYPVLTAQRGERRSRGEHGERMRIRYQELATDWFWYLFTTPESLLKAVDDSAVWKVVDLVRRDECFLVVMQRTG